MIQIKFSVGRLLSFLPVFFALMSVLSTYAQETTVSGVVRLSDGSPVSNATVSVSGKSLRTMTDEKGSFAFQNLETGTYELEVSSLEIQTQVFKATAGRGGRPIVLTVRPMTDKVLEGVTVERKTEKRKLETGGFAVAVIETKEASLRNLTTNELLDRAVGVRVRQNGGVGSHVEYNLNGMSGSTVGIFIDGIQSSTFGSSFNLNNIPPSMIERIEIYKGVLPSHLSGNYIGGAINVVMKKGVSQNSATVALSYGSFGTYNADIGTNYRHGRSGFTFRGSAFRNSSDNSYTTWGESTTYVDHMGRITRPFRAKRFNNDYRANAGRFEAGFTDVAWADVFFLGYNISKSHADVPHGISMATPYVGRFTEASANVWSLNYAKRDLLADGLALTVNATKSDRNTYLQDTVTYLYNWDNTLREIIDDGERKPIRLSYTDRFGQKRYMAQQGQPTMTSIDRNILTARSNLTYMPFSGHRISLNHAYHKTERDDNDLLNPVDKDLVTTGENIQNIFAFNYEAEFWQRRIKTNAQLKHTADRNNQRKVDFVTQNGQQVIHRRDTSIFTDNLGYSFALAFRFAPKLYLVTSTETSFVSPTETQLMGAPERNIVPNMDLQPEKNVNHNLGLRTDAFAIGRHRVSLYGSAFWRNGYDKISTETLDAANIDNVDNATLDVTRYINLGMTQARGFEAELIYIHNNRLNASFNISRFNNLYKQETDSEGKPSPYHNQQVANEPYFTINLNTQYRMDNVLGRRSVLNLYYTFGYVHAYNIAWGNPAWGITPTQYIHDAGASYRFPSQKMVVSLDLKNIFDAELYDNFKQQKPGRGIYLKLNYTIGKFL